MNIYLESFGIFFKIGAFTIGGLYRAIAEFETRFDHHRRRIRNGAID